MKKIFKFLKKGIIVTLLCLTITNTVTVPSFTPQETISTCEADTEDANDDVEPLGVLHYC